VLKETNVTDAGAKALASGPDVSAEGGGGAVGTTPTATRAEQAATAERNEDLTIPVSTPAGPGWFQAALIVKYVLPTLSNIGTYRHTRRPRGTNLGGP